MRIIDGNTDYQAGAIVHVECHPTDNGASLIFTESVLGGDDNLLENRIFVDLNDDAGKRLLRLLSGVYGHA